MKKTRDEYLGQPFLDYKGVMAVISVCGKNKAYEIMKSLLKEKDENGNQLVDPNRMPDVGKIIVPTEVLCKKYKIKRTRKKDAI